MNLSTLLPMFNAIGFALLHSVWQLAVIAVVSWMVLSIVRTPAKRYVVSYAALLLSGLVLPGDLAYFASTRVSATTVLDHQRTGTSDSFPQVFAHQHASAAQPSVAAKQIGLTLLPGSLWLAGVCLLSIRHVAAWRDLRRWRRHAVAITDSELLDRWQALAARLGVSRAVCWFESASVKVPSLISFWRPTIFLPIGLVAELHPLQLEALLAHELAHVRRQDYLLNLLQIAIETLLFYHPAIWWLGREVRWERECACDESAAEVVGDRRLLAVALARLTESAQASALVLAAGHGPVLKRVRRLLDSSRQPPGSWITIVIPILILMMGGVLYRPITAARAQAPTTRNDEPKPTSTPDDSNEQLMKRLSTASQELTTLQLQRIELAARLPATDPNLVAVNGQTLKKQQEYDQLLRQVVRSRGGPTTQLGGATTTLSDERQAELRAARLTQLRDELQAIEERRRAAEADHNLTLANACVEEMTALHAAIDLEIAHASGLPLSATPGGEYYVTGFGARNGVYSLSGRTITLPQALISAGVELDDQMIYLYPGPSNQQGGPLIFTAEELRDKKLGAYCMQPDDKVVVSKTKLINTATTKPADEYYIGGDAPRTGIYSCAGRRIDLMQALIAAGCDITTAAPSMRIELIHRRSDREEQLIVCTVGELLAGTEIIIQPEDQIRVNPHDAMTQPAQ